MRVIPCRAVVIVGYVALANMTASAQLTSPNVGWQAELSRLAHNVSGTVTILDENTIQVDDFTYDGGGLDVLFYLGKAETKAAFTAGLPIGDQLFGLMFDGTGPPMVIDLPAGQTMEGWNAISVWCVDVNVSFGSGTFSPMSAAVPGDYNGNGTVDAADYVIWRNTMGQEGSSLAADGNGNGAVENGDYDFWRSRMGLIAGGGAVASASTVPEPGAWIVASSVVVGLLALPRRRR